MKRIAINIVATTGIALVVLAIYGALCGGTWLRISSIFQTFGACAAIQAGFLITHRFESPWAVLDASVDIAYAIVVLVAAGAMFDWYQSTPIWVLAAMAVLVYGLLLGLSMVRMREEISDINQLLERRGRSLKEGTKTPMLKENREDKKE